MKSMQEIVNSIKNDRLRAVAGELQEMLQGVRNAITVKRQRGERVSEEEKASLRQSLSNYVKKGLSAVLVTAMLTSCLASCEAGKIGENQGENNKETTVGSAQDSTDQGKLVIVAPKGEAVSPESCGLGVLSAFDLTTILTDDSAYQGLEKFYNALLDGQEYYDADNSSAMMASGIFYMTGGSNKSTSVMFVQRDENSGWTQRLISGYNELVLISVNGDGEAYATGLMEGTLRNDLGLITENQIDIFEEMAVNMSYSEILSTTRKNFFGEMYNMWEENKLEGEYFVENVKVDGVVTPYPKLRVQMRKLYLPDENENDALKMIGHYDLVYDGVIYDYLDKEETQAE